jgi:hypothetical protein
LVNNVHKSDPRNNPNILGIRDLGEKPTVPGTKKALTAKQALIMITKNFLEMFGDKYLSDLDEEAKKRYQNVLDIAGDYVKGFMFIDGKPPVSYDQSPGDIEVHELVFERVIFNYSRTSIPTPDAEGMYSSSNDHLIPLHLCKGRWAAKEILMAAMNNRRPKNKVQKEVLLLVFN